jgi:GH3 auxin-responsive promoter
MAFRSGGEPAAVHSSLWPDLRLFGFWDAAHAALHAPEAARLFPRARVQGKGLISTECFVSLPLTGRAGAVLALRSHFLEFVPHGSEDETLLAHELDEGGRYSVVVTTGGGLYRYRMGDIVEVTGRFERCPLIRFFWQRRSRLRPFRREARRAPRPRGSASSARLSRARRPLRNARLRAGTQQLHSVYRGW